MSSTPPPPLMAESPAPVLPIVGIGASAGGVEALEQFFRRTSADCGMAFVLITHLDPSHASLLTEILQRTTPMPVVEAQDQMAVAANVVYVIPPDRDMSIFQGKLQAREPVMPQGHRMPIDVFLRSLAEDIQERAIGIILSGMGTDGTLGLSAVIGAGGITLVQEPATAHDTSMPASAIRAGFATHVLPVEQMPMVLQACSHNPTLPIISTPTPIAAGDVNQILMQLRMQTGHDFSLYKTSTIGRRIESHMSQHNIGTIEAYAHYLKENPGEMQVLFNELLINVTSFFRDAEVFNILQQAILPQLCQNKPENYEFRIWVAGCATGEEAYSIAITLREWMTQNHQTLKVQIYSTDLDADAIAIARAGIYSPNIAQDVSPERLQRFFVKETAGYRIRKEIREMIVFAVHNVIKDPPFTRLDLLSCRNLMIYLEPELQNRLIPAFHHSLKPNGVLLLAPSESIGNFLDQFAVLNRKWRFYRAIHDPGTSGTMMSQTLAWTAETGNKPTGHPMPTAKETNFAELTQKTLLQHFAPASVITDCKGVILYIHGETGKYLRPAPGNASLSVIEMAREGLALVLGAAIAIAANEKRPTLNQQIPVKTNGGFTMVSLSVRPLLGQDGKHNLLLISFQDIANVANPKRKQTVKPAELSRIEELEHDLAYQIEIHQALIEKQQAYTEELKSFHEECQSTNEELESSREELQSVNDELVTVNSELQAKNEQLASMQNDMKNLLDNINVGIIFLDQHLQIRSFNREALRAYHLVASDVGRPLTDIKAVADDYDDLLSAAQSVLESLIPYERKLHTNDDTWLLARVQPYYTLDNMPDGVALTFTDITSCVRALAAKTSLNLTQGIVDTLAKPLMVLDASLKVVSASRAYYQTFHATPEQTLGHDLFTLNGHRWDLPSLRQLLGTVPPCDGVYEKFAMAIDIPNIGSIDILLDARRIIVKADDPQMILLLMEIDS